METAPIESIEEAELWKFRALKSEQKAIMAEIAVLKMKYEDLDAEIGGFLAVLAKKYKTHEFDVEGKLIYRDKGE